MPITQCDRAPSDRRPPRSTLHHAVRQGFWIQMPPCSSRTATRRLLQRCLAGTWRNCKRGLVSSHTARRCCQRASSAACSANVSALWSAYRLVLCRAPNLPNSMQSSITTAHAVAKSCHYLRGPHDLRSRLRMYAERVRNVLL